MLVILFCAKQLVFAAPFCPSAPANCNFNSVDQSLAELKESRFLGALKSQDSSCKLALSQAPKTDQVLQQLMLDPRFVGYVTPTISQCWKQGAAGVGKVEALSRYAYIQKRLDDTAVPLADYLSFADSVLGRNQMSDLPSCKNTAPELSGFITRCSEIKAGCKKADASVDLAKTFISSYESQNIANVEQQTAALDKRLKYCVSEMVPDFVNKGTNWLASVLASKNFYEKFLKKDAKCSELAKQRAAASLKLQLFYGSFPWAQQDTFKKIAGKNFSTDLFATTKALKAQVHENADHALKQLNEITFASKCLLRGNCDTGKLHDVLEKTNPIPDQYFFTKGQSKEDFKNRAAVNSFVGYNNCVDDLGQSQRKTSEVLWSSTVGAVGAVATLGGSLAITGLATGSKVLMGAASVGSRAANVGKATFGIGQTIDGAMTVQSLYEAAHHCGSKIYGSTSGPANESANACGVPSKGQMEFKAEYDGCVLEAVFGVAGAAAFGIGLKTQRAANKLAEAKRSGAKKLADGEINTKLDRNADNNSATAESRNLISPPGSDTRMMNLEAEEFTPAASSTTNSIQSRKERLDYLRSKKGNPYSGEKSQEEIRTEVNRAYWRQERLGTTKYIMETYGLDKKTAEGVRFACDELRIRPNEFMDKYKDHVDQARTIGAILKRSDKLLLNMADLKRVFKRSDDELDIFKWANQTSNSPDDLISDPKLSYFLKHNLTNLFNLLLKHENDFFALSRKDQRLAIERYVEWHKAKKAQKQYFDSNLKTIIQGIRFENETGIEYDAFRKGSLHLSENHEHNIYVMDSANYMIEETLDPAEIVGKATGRNIAFLADIEDNKRFRPHLNEHTLSQKQIRAQVVALAHRRTEAMKMIVDKIEIKDAAPIRSEITKSYGDIFATNQGFDVLDDSKLFSFLVECAAGNQSNAAKLKASACGKQTRRALCESAGLVGKALGECNTNPSFKIENINLADTASRIREKILEVVADRTEKERLAILANGVQNKNNLDFRFSELSPRGANKTTGYWPRVELNNFLKEFTDDKFKVTPEILASKKGAIIESETTINKGANFIHPDTKEPGESTRYLIKFGDYQVEVFVCAKMPCPNDLYPGAILTIYPRCGPTVVNLISTVESLSSIKTFQNPANQVKSVPCK